MGQDEFELGRGSPSWPGVLEALSRPPTRLRVRGRLPAFERAVAVVGTRRADPEACEFAWRLGRDLTRVGCVVVSGGARGIDRAVHLGALDDGGVTVAVLATGFRPAYPREHGELFARVAESGALVTELPDGIAPLPWHFIHRNRLIAGLAAGVVVVQAPARSGALSTAAATRALGRPVWAVPASPWDPRGAGCLRLLARGAQPCLGASDIVRPLFEEEQEPMRMPPSLPVSALAVRGATGEQRRVLSVLRGRARSVDELCQETGWPLAKVYQTLSELELTDAVERRPGGRYAHRLRI